MRKAPEMSEFNYAQLKAVKLDDEFRDLVPLPERKKSDPEAGLSAPAFVWQWNHQLILLIGYQVWKTLLKRRMPFPVIIKQFPNRGEARLFIIQHHLQQRIVSPLMLSYVRGQRCRPEKRRPGRPAALPPTAGAKFGKRLTMENLAEQYGVTRETLRLDMDFANGVDCLLEVLEKESGLKKKQRQEVKRLLLGCTFGKTLKSRGPKVTRERVKQLAKKETPTAVKVQELRELLRTGRLPRPAKESKHFLFPVEGAEAQAKLLIMKVGPEVAAKLCGKVLAKLASPGPEKKDFLFPVKGAEAQAIILIEKLGRQAAAELSQRVFADLRSREPENEPDSENKVAL